MPMTAADFEQWKNLPHSIVRKYFGWAYEHSNHRHKRIRRYLDYDDLAQEATMGMLDAWDCYQENHASGASFMTYAYKSAIRRVATFIDMNITPVTVRGYRQAAKGKNAADALEKAARAMSCGLFSEKMDELRQRKTPGAWADKEFRVYDRSPDHVDVSEINDFHRHCISQLKKHLTRSEFAILMEKNRGRTNSQIGKKRGYTRERARQIINQIMIKATNILVPELRYAEG